MLILLYQTAIQNQVKILWLTHRDPLNPKAGGAERIVYEIGTYLIKKGNELSIITGGWSGSKNRDYLNGMEIIRFGKRLGPHFAVPIFLLKRKYDVIIADLGHAVPWVSPVIFRKNIVVSFVHLHARSLPGQVNKVLAYLISSLEKIYFIIYSKASFVTISSTSFEDLKNLGINEDHISLINPGVNSTLFKPGEKTEYPSVVYFGGIRPYKRPMESIYIIKELLKKMQDVKLTVIGNGVLISEMKKLAFDLGIEKSIFFTGRLNDEDVAKIVSKSWLNIHSSTTEGWGISIIEAASAGTPTVAYNVPGVMDSIENGKNGIKVKDGDRFALINAALEILNEPKKWWSSSLDVANKYTWAKAAESWENQIKQTYYKNKGKE